MKTSLFAFFLSLLLTLPSGAGEVTLFAAASLTEAMEEAAKRFEAMRGGETKVIANFAGSSTLARQIEEGARADLFFSADEAQMDRLARSGLIRAGTRRTLLSNTLVIVVLEKGRQMVPAELPTLRRIALADPEAVPAGVYAKAYLQKLGLWAAVEPKVVPTENVRGALAALEAGNVDAAIVYKTDAALSRKAFVAFEVPRAEGPLIAYPVALLRDARAAEEGAAFLDFLESPEGRAIFERFGFLSRQP